jgi:hypothetical protein
VRQLPNAEAAAAGSVARSPVQKKIDAVLGRERARRPVQRLRPVLGEPGELCAVRRRLDRAAGDLADEACAAVLPAACDHLPGLQVVRQASWRDRVAVVVDQAGAPSTSRDRQCGCA